MPEHNHCDAPEAVVAAVVKELSCQAPADPDSDLAGLTPNELHIHLRQVEQNLRIRRARTAALEKQLGDARCTLDRIATIAATETAKSFGMDRAYVTILALATGSCSCPVPEEEDACSHLVDVLESKP